MDLKDMPAHLGVGTEVIQGSVDSIVQSGKGLLINDSIVTQKYLIGMVEEIADLVQDKGLVELSDLTNKYWLPLAFLKDTILQNVQILPIGSTIQNNALISNTFAERLFCKVRGIMRGITRPTSINMLSQRFQIDELKLKSLIDQLIKNGEISGKISKG